jgi:acyl transferase domain-containing protein
MKRQIVNESQEDKKKRKQEASRKSSAEHLARQTPEQKEIRLAKNRESTRRRRANETALKTEARLETERIRSQQSRATESTPENTDRLEAMRIRSQQSLAAENTPDNEDRLEAMRILSQQSRAAESTPENADRLETERIRSQQSRASENSPDYEVRLEIERDRIHQHRANETTPEVQERRAADILRVTSARLNIRANTSQIDILNTTVIEENRALLYADLKRASHGEQTLTPLHAHAAVQHMATSFLTHQFAQSLQHCISCSQRWWPETTLTHQPLNQCLQCFTESKKRDFDGVYKFGTSNDMNPLVHADIQLQIPFRTAYDDLLLNFPLTTIEEALIAKVAVFMQAFRLKGGRSGFSGNVICFPQRVSDIVTKLPRRTDQLKIIIARMRIVSTTTVPRDYKDFKVRRAHVSNWLHFLLKWSSAYADVCIDEDNLSLLPHNGSVYDELVAGEYNSAFVPPVDQDQALLEDIDTDDEEDIGFATGPVQNESIDGDNVIITGVGEPSESRIPEYLLIQNILVNNTNNASDNIGSGNQKDDHNLFNDSDFDDIMFDNDDDNGDDGGNSCRSTIARLVVHITIN